MLYFHKTCRGLKKTGREKQRFLLFNRKMNRKTVRAEGFQKCPEIKSVLYFFKYVFYDVFVVRLRRSVEVVLRCAVVNANLFVCLFVRLFACLICSSFG